MAKVKNWLVFDCETDSFDGAPVRPWIWGVKENGGAEFIFYSTVEFIEYLKEFDGLAYAHNGGKFDALFLVEYMTPGEIKIINGRLSESRIGRAIIRDSFLIVPEALGKAGNKDKFDYEIFNRNKKHLRKKHKEEIEKYLLQDVRGLHEIIAAFFARFGQRLTLPGACMAHWEEMGGLKRRWGGNHDRIMRQFYYGGRCQALAKGKLKGEWNYLDIKSAYPYAMLHDHTACHYSDFISHTNLSRLTGQCFVILEGESRGCLPVRGKYAIDYPLDSSPRKYFATGWEVLAGLDTGTLKINKCTILEPTKFENFAPYVNKFYAEKLEAEKTGDKVGRGIAKRSMNSLSGKYGAAADAYEKFWLVKANTDCPRNNECTRGLECKYLKPTVEGWKCAVQTHAEVGEYDVLAAPSPGQHFDVACAASITGFVRAYWWRHVCAQTSPVAYGDTDSLMIGGEPVGFDMGENLGQWELAHRLKNLYIAGKKLYTGIDCDTGKEVNAHKGFSPMDTGRKDIIRAAMGKIIKVKKKAPTIKMSGLQLFIARKMRAT